MTRTLIAAAAIALFAASPGLAQAAGMMASGYQMTRTDALASKVIGSPVYSTTALNGGASPAAATTAGTTTAANAKGSPASSATDTSAQQIGTVRDVVMGTDGKASAVVIGIGGILGIGEKNVAVAYGDIKWAVAVDGSIRGTLDTTADALKSAPDFQYPATGQATKAGDTANAAANGSPAVNDGKGTMAPRAVGTAMPPVTDPQTFATTAATSNLFEIQSSQLEVQKGTSTDAKAFAQKMIADHTAAGQKMQAAAQSQKVSVPTALDATHQQQLSQLQGMSGDQLDQAYIAAQVPAHDDAVALFQGYRQSGPAGALKDFAAAALPTLQMHQQMIHKLAGE